MNSIAPEISIVIPLHNEEQVFGELISTVQAVLSEIDLTAEVLLVDDGSFDKTREKIRHAIQADPCFKAICFSRNFGHQAAITAGLFHARGTLAVFIMDGDLQDPPHLLPVFIQQMKNGYEVVYGVRKTRKIGWLKSMIYGLYYRFLRSVSSINMPLDSGDFALISRKVVDAINRMPEYNRYNRGLRAYVGFKQTGIEYDRPDRLKGESKYTWGKLFKLAFNGIFNFSELPVRIITSLGLLTFTIASIYLCYNLIKKFVFHDVPEGFTATLVVIIMFAGVQLIALGLIGEYVLRIFIEVKRRPLYVIEEELSHL